MKKYTLLFATLFLTIITAYGQIYDPVSWNFSYEKTGDGEYDLLFTATIEEHSHLYSMNLPDGGPIPTQFTFTSTDGYELVGEIKESGEDEVVFDKAFEMDIRYFSNSAEFRQTVKTIESSFKVAGYVTYMACDDEKCSPPQDVDFEFIISAGESDAAGIEASDKADIADRESGIVKFFILSLLAGLAGVLTPCVFPMIPMTVAFFSQGNESRGRSVTKAFVFGLSIILIYSSLGIIVSLTSAGANFANTLSTHWIPNILFFSLFIIFAASFFGAFELVLPNKWISGADSKVDKGGIVAAFFLGLTTVLVSFSCTGPIVGVLLVEAASGDVLRPTIGMFGFGLAFALPFTIFALFPSVMKKMPKSGGWLNSIKVVLGFIMLAFSLKFISTIDSVYGFGIITRDIYLAIWIVIFLLLGFYLMGKIKFAHDSDLPYIGVFRLILIIAVFSLVVYLIPGLFGAPLKGLSGLIPSKESALFDISANKSSSSVPASSFPAFQLSEGTTLCAEPKYGDKLHLPHGLNGYFDYEQGMACAGEKNLPVLLDFKGHACSNCKEMEAKVWSDPDVLRRLNENFVIIALYTDDRTKLPEDEWITSDIDGKVKNTIGKINADREIEMFGTNSQPYYVITDHDGNALNKPMESNLNISEYIKWLDEGEALFNKGN
ncbi:MAG: thioredoxin family protein [Bacteroidales bacterium]|nr:thioredoxin family protein [Bacteroidales bacterium]